jgi:hypothetical protein
MDDPRVMIRQMALAMRTSRLLYVAAEMGLADHVANGPMGSAELASAVSADAGAIRRLMRVLCVMGMFSEEAPGQYRLTAMGDHLRRDHPRSLRPVVLFLAGPFRWQLWSDLLESVRTGEAATQRLFGCDIFEYYATHPTEQAIMSENMRASSDLATRAIVASCDFSRFSMLIDIGGGTGELLGSVLAANPQLHGILLDRPAVVAQAHAVLEQHGVADRCTVQAGDFFEAVPRGADALMLKNVLHDWNDLKAIDILIRCREAMSRNARLLVIDRLMPPRAEAGAQIDPFLIDLDMLVGAGGCERTEAEFGTLLSRAGLALTTITPTRALGLAIIEGRLA